MFKTLIIEISRDILIYYTPLGANSDAKIKLCEFVFLVKLGIFFMYIFLKFDININW